MKLSWNLNYFMKTAAKLNLKQTVCIVFLFFLNTCMTKYGWAHVLQTVLTASKRDARAPAVHWVSCSTTVSTAGLHSLCRSACTVCSGVAAITAFRRRASTWFLSVSCWRSCRHTGRSTTRVFSFCRGAMTSVKWWVLSLQLGYDLS